MKIILTNDDGIEAPGLAALEQACEKLGELVVVAPSEEQSGVGHRVTADQPMLVESLAPNRIAVQGSPADCTRIGLRHVFADDADAVSWVVAGINRGGNLGADFYPSGTVAAAREAAFLGKRALAISQFVRRGRELNWDATTRRAQRVIEDLVTRDIPAGAFWNVNLPHPEDDAADCDVVFCPLDSSPMSFTYKQTPNGLLYDGNYFERPRQVGGDVDICFSGSIAVSLMSIHGVGIPIDSSGCPLT